MCLVAHIVDAQNCISSQPALKRQRIFFRGGNSIGRRIGGYTVDRLKLREINLGVGGLARRAQWSPLGGKRLSVVEPSRGRDKRRRKKRRPRAGVSRPIRSVCAGYPDRERFDRAVKRPETRANTGLSRPPED